MPGEKSTEVEINERVMLIAKAMLEGYTNRRILLQYLSEKYNKWGKQDRMIDIYISSAKEIIADIMQNDLEFEKNLALNRLDALYSMNYKIHDFRECRNIIETRAKILGYNAAESIKLEVNETQTKEDFLAKMNKAREKSE
jgi:hypothetical protein